MSKAKTETPKKSKKPIWGSTFELVKDYFVNSDEKLIAWLLLAGITICIIGLVVLTVAFAWWSAAFWGIIAAKTLIPFLTYIGYFALLATATTGLYALKNYLIGKLSLLWRNWLTNKIINELFYGENNYLDLKRFSDEVKNISQRIQEDVRNFVELTLNLSADLLKSVLSLGTFVGTLWIVGGALSFVLLGLNIVIPGYLVWAALLVALIATVSAHFIGRSLAKTNKKTEDAEADLRQDLNTLNEDAENIAEEHAEQYYQESLKDKTEAIGKYSNKKLKTQTKLDSFIDGFEMTSEILPILCAAPLYFTGLVEMGQLTQIVISFFEVNSALSWFVNAYEDLSKYQTSVERLIELQNAFNKEGLASNEKLITRREKPKETIKIKNLNVLKPQKSSADYILRNLNLKLHPGEHVLIKGRSGKGKSTVFKIISGTWKYGNGAVTLPAGKSMHFLPQTPTIPNNTLKAILAYPASIYKMEHGKQVDRYTYEEYEDALRTVGGMEKFINYLKKEEKLDWSNILSGGEKQRISFARVLLEKPNWLFLDEATSSLDEESEYHVYSALIEKLKNTTIVSIAHRSTVIQHHHKILLFKVKDDQVAEIEEQWLDVPAASSSHSNPI